MNQKKYLLGVILAVLAVVTCCYFSFPSFQSIDEDVTLEASVSATASSEWSVAEPEAIVAPGGVNEVAAVSHEASPATPTGPLTELFAKSEVLQTRRLASVQVDLLNTPFKYPLVRVERLIDSTSGLIDSSLPTAMVASHVVIDQGSREALEDFVQLQGGRTLKLERLSHDAGYILSDSMPMIDTVPGLIRELAQVGIIAEPDYIVYPMDAPESGGDHESVPGAGSTVSIVAGRVKVGLIDSGVDLNHPALLPALFFNETEVEGALGVDDDLNGFNDDIQGWDFVDDDTEPNDLNGHGTHVAGILAGVASDEDESGLVEIVPVRVLDQFGLGTVSDAIAAIGYMNANGVRIINVSWGTPGNSGLLEQAIHDSDALFIAAAGNNGALLTTNPVYPAAYPLDNVLTVGALGADGALAPFSNFDSYAVDVLALGEAVQSTELDGQFGTRSGTSMAAPLLSAAAAQFLTVQPRADFSAIAGFLRATWLEDSALVECAQEGHVFDAAALDSSLAALPVVEPLSGELTLYDVDFSIPPHTADSTPLLGVNGVGAVVFGAPLVREQVGAYLDDSLEFEGGHNGCCGYYEQIRFYGSAGVSEYEIEFDLYIDRLVDGEFVILLDTPQVRRIDFMPDGTIDSFSGSDIGTFTQGETFSMRIRVSIAESKVWIWKNSVLLHTGAFSPSEDDIETIRAHLGSETLDSNRVAFDNFRWVANPVPLPEGPAELELSSTSIDFGDVRTDQSRELEVTATNVGGEPLLLSDFSTSVGFTSEMSGLTLQPLEATTINVTFAPAGTGAAVGTLEFTTNEATENDYSIELTGTGVGLPVASVSDDPILLSVLAGDTFSEVIDLENVGESALGWSIVYRERSSDVAIAPGWIDAAPSSGTLLNGSSVEITFNGDTIGLAPGDHELDVVIVTDAPDQAAITIALTLTVEANPRLSLSTESIDFGSAFVAATLSQVLTFENVGSSDLEVSSIVAGHSAFSTDFSETLTIPAGGSSSITVFFTPDSISSFESTLSITSNDAVAFEVSVDVSGAGAAAPQIELSLDALEFETPFGTNPEAQTVTVTNVGGFDLNVALDIVASVESEVVGFTPAYLGHSEFGLSKEDAEAIYSDVQHLSYQASPQWSPSTAALEPPTLDEVLAALDDMSPISALIPNRFDFSDGVTGYYIYDGGSDMFDVGNYIRLNGSGSYLTYSNGVLNTYPTTAPFAEYFTLKQPGLFVLAADIDQASIFGISGGLGADGAGIAEGVTIESNVQGASFTGFLKRVHSAKEPSVNQLVIFRSNGEATHAFNTNTNYAEQTVSGLDGVSRVYYLLFASASGGIVSNEEAMAIMEAFLTQIGEGGWLDVSPPSLQIAAGESAVVNVEVTSAGMDSGTYELDIRIDSNDPLNETQTIPVSLSVDLEPLVFNQEQFEFTAIQGLAVESQTLELLPHGGESGDTWEIEESISWLELDETSGSLPASVELSIVLDGLLPGIYTEEILVRSGGALQRIQIELSLAELEPFFIEASPYEDAVYGLSEPAEVGAPSLLLKVNDATGVIERSAQLLPETNDLAFSSDGRYIYAFAGQSSTIAKVSTETLQIISERLVGGLQHNSSYAAAYSLEIRSDEALLLTDAYYTPKLLSFDYSDLGQTVGETLESTNWGWGHFKVDAQGENIYGSRMSSSSSSRGSLLHSRIIDGAVYTSVYGDSTSGIVIGEPIFISPSGSWISYNRFAYLDGDFQQRLPLFSEPIKAASYYGHVAIGETSIFDGFTGALLHSFEDSTDLRTVTRDQSKVISFDSTLTEFVAFDLTSVRALPGLGVNPIPADGGAVTSGSTLRWTDGGDGGNPYYMVFVGASEAAVTSATLGSPEFLGIFDGNEAELPAGLASGSDYFWRIDVIEGSQIRLGSVQRFRFLDIALSPKVLVLKTVSNAATEKGKITVVTSDAVTSWSLQSSSPRVSFSSASGVGSQDVQVTVDVSELGLGTHHFNYQLGFDGHWFNQSIVLEIVSPNLQRVLSDPLRSKVYALHYANNDLIVLDVALDTQEIVDALVVEYGSYSLYSVDALWEHLYCISPSKQVVTQIDLDKFEMKQQVGVPLYNTYPSSFAAFNDGRVAVAYGYSSAPLHVFDLESGEVETVMTGNIRKLQVSRDQQALWTVKYNSSSHYVAERYGLSNDDLWELHASSPSFSGHGSYMPVLDSAESRIYFGTKAYLDAETLLPLFLPTSEEVYTLSSVEQYALTRRGLMDMRDGTLLPSQYLYNHAVLTADESTIVRVYSSTLYFIDVLSSVALPGVGVRPLIEDESIVFETVDALKWSADSVGHSYHVYWGFDETAVANADTSSELYRGVSLSEQLDLDAAFDRNLDVFWRVDVVRGDAIVPGEVWSFTTADFTLSAAGIDETAIQLQRGRTVSVTLDCEPDADWSVELPVDVSSWLSIESASGVGSGKIHFQINPSALSVGIRNTSATITVDAVSIDFPIQLKVEALKLAHLVEHPNEDYLIGFSGASSDKIFYLVQIDKSDLSITKLIEMYSYVTSLALDEERERVLLTQSGSTTVMAWDLLTDAVSAAFTTPYVPSKLIMLPNNRILTKESSNLRFRDLNTGTEFHPSLYLGSYGNFAMDDNRERLVVSHYSSSVSLRAYDYVNSVVTAVWTSSHVNYPRYAPLLADDTHSVVLTTSLFDADGSLIRTLPATMNALSPDGELAAATNGLYSTATGSLVQSFSATVSLFSQDGRDFYTYGNANSTPELSSYRIDGGAINLDPDSIVFEDTFNFDTSIKTLRIDNLGFSGLTVSAFDFEDDVFSTSQVFPILIPAQGYKLVQLEFSPETEGEFDGDLYISSNDEGNPVVTVSLSGTSIEGPSLVSSPASLSASLRNQETVDLTLKLENVGGAGLTYSISPGAQASWLSVSPFQGTVGVDGFVDITVSLMAGNLLGGTYDNTILITTNDPLNRLVSVPVALEVDAIPVIQLSESSFEFGRVLKDLESSQKALIVTNIGGEDLDVDLSMTANAAHYSVTPEVLQLASEEQATVTLTFEPSEGGPLAGTLHLDTNAPSNPDIDLELDGFGADVPSISVDPDSLLFELNSGDVGDLDIEIGNDASEFSELSFNLSIRNPESASTAILSSGSVSVDYHYPDKVDDVPVEVAAQNTPDALSDATVFVVTGGAFISEISPLTGATIRTIGLPESVSGGPDGLAYDGASFYFVNNFGQRTIYQIDAITGELVRTLPVSQLNVDGLAHDGEFLYALDYSSNTISVIAMETGVLRTLSPGLSIGGGLSAGGSRGTLFASSFSGDVLEIDKVSGEVVNQISNSATVYGVGYSEAAGTLVLGDYGLNRVRYIDPDTGAYLGSTALSGSASAVAADEASDGHSDWLSVDPSSDLVVGGESVTVFATADAASMIAGTYEKEIVITSSDTEQPELIVAVTLIVTGAPGVEVTPDALNFGTLFVGGNRLEQLQIRNVGTDVLVVSSVSGLGDELTLEDVSLPLSLNPGAKTTLDVRLQPRSAGELSRSFQINSNDESDPSVTVNSSAVVLEPPVLEVSDTRMDFEMSPGEDGSDLLTLTNTGGSSLEWNLSFALVNDPLSASSFVSSASVQPLPDLNATSVAGTIIVRFDSGVTAGDRTDLISALGATLTYSSRLVDGLVVLDLPESMSAASAISSLSSDERVRYAEPDYIVSVGQAISASSVDDPRFDELWGLKNTGQSGGVVDADIDADEAWELSIGSRQVLVGVIDTGVDYTHPDLAANMWQNPNEIPENGIDDDSNGYVDDVHGWDFAYNDNDPMDVHGHGTHVAGTIGAVGNNGLGVVGVSQLCTIVPIKFLNDSGSGITSNAIECVEYAVSVGVDITNNSWGGGGFNAGLRDVIAAAGATGQLFVAAAGNSSVNADLSPHYPSNYDVDEIISVAATDRNDLLSSYSNYGANTVDLAAPGSAILSTLPNASYGSKNGTSMAAPHVAGAAALLKAYSPGATMSDLKQALMNSVDHIPSLNNRVLSDGRLNLRAALNDVLPPWLSFSLPSGSLESDEAAQVTLSVDSTDLSAGRYSGVLIIRSNDPAAPTLNLPVILHLSESMGIDVRYMAWAHSKIEDMDVEREVDSWGPLADPDHDGRLNIFEYLSNSDPNGTNDSAEEWFLDESNFVWRTEFNEDAQTLNVTFETALELDGEPWSSDDVQRRTYSEDGVSYLEFSVPVGEEGNRFGRCRIELPTSE